MNAQDRMTTDTSTPSSTTTIVRLQTDELRKSRSLWQDALRHLWRDRLTMIAFGFLLLMTLVCFFGPPVVERALGVDATRTSVPDRFLSPGVEGHPLGTDHLGRDQLVRLLYGGQVSLAIAYSASLMSIFIGVTLGLLAGFYGGRVDDLIVWLVNTLSAIPALFLLLIAAALWQPSVEVLVIVLALLGWVGTSRLVRAEVLALKERDYILAARALGASGGRLMALHILPNVLPIVIVTLTIIAGNLILTESGLSFLGVGVQPPTPSWGNMLTDSRNYFVTGVHLVFWPGLLIMVTVLCFYLVGDGLRDALDPRTSRR
ncbi:MAG: ABC transporter permease [Anaerolineae bacterium]|nr:ABC transporter permease [Anaerolineae bacterium]